MENFGQQFENEKTLEEKISKLRENLKEIYSFEFSTFGHGTSEECAKKILENGLETKNSNLDETIISLFDSSLPYDKQSDEVFKNILNWKHRDYKYIVTVMIPNPKKDEQGGRNYFNSVFEELPEDKKVDVGIQGADREYVIPPHFIKGYIDANSLEFIENEKYNPLVGVEMKEIEQVVPHESNIDNIEIPKPAGSEDVW
ncbi:MAG: hypothetical protein WCX30_01705 [Candidatus Paceibacterota bacterium]|jgi:hypothetical protein|nr:hypothetical protein [bacterium]